MLSSATTRPPAWRLNPAVDLHWRVWGTDCVAFESVSGTTAVIEPFDAALMSLFDGGAQSLDALAQAVAADLGLPVDDAVTEHVQGVVEQFLARGWLKAIDSAG